MKAQHLVVSFILYFAGNLAWGECCSCKERPVFYERFYLRGNVKLPTYRDFSGFKMQFTPGGQIAAGMNFGDYFSAELECDYFGFKLRNKNVALGDNRNLTLWAGFLNVIGRYPIYPDQYIDLFVGGGVGYAISNVSEPKSDLGTPLLINKQGSRNFAYQAFLGSEWLVMENISIVIDLRWIATQSKYGVPNILQYPTLNGSESAKLAIQTFTVGVKWRF